MVGWHHRLDGHESEQALGDGEGQGRLACCSPWGRRELDVIGQLNNSNTTVHCQHYYLHALPSEVLLSCLPKQVLLFSCFLMWGTLALK